MYCNSHGESAHSSCVLMLLLLLLKNAPLPYGVDFGEMFVRHDHVQPTSDQPPMAQPPVPVIVVPPLLAHPQGRCSPLLANAIPLFNAHPQTRCMVSRRLGSLSQTRHLDPCVVRFFSVICIHSVNLESAAIYLIDRPTVLPVNQCFVLPFPPFSGGSSRSNGSCCSADERRR